MADIKVSALAAGTAITDADLFYYIDGSTSKKVTALILHDYVLGGVNLGMNVPAYGLVSYYLGSGALAADLDGTEDSVAIGKNAMNDSTDAHRSVCVGTGAGEKLTTGTDSVLIGYHAGDSIVDVNGCVCIGSNAGGLNTTANLLYIENTNSETPLIGGDFTNNRVGINRAIGSLAYTLDVGGDIAFTGALYRDTTAIIDTNGYFIPVTAADGSAPNNSIYFSSTGAALTYKDGGGTPHSLY
jgi:hypothetical protein